MLQFQHNKGAVVHRNNQKPSHSLADSTPFILTNLSGTNFCVNNAPIKFQMVSIIFRLATQQNVHGVIITSSSGLLLGLTCKQIISFRPPMAESLYGNFTQVCLCLSVPKLTPMDYFFGSHAKIVSVSLSRLRGHHMNYAQAGVAWHCLECEYCWHGAKLCPHLTHLGCLVLVLACSCRYAVACCDDLFVPILTLQGASQQL